MVSSQGALEEVIAQCSHANVDGEVVLVTDEMRVELAGRTKNMNEQVRSHKRVLLRLPSLSFQTHLRVCFKAHALALVQHRNVQTLTLVLDKSHSHSVLHVTLA